MVGENLFSHPRFSHFAPVSGLFRIDQVQSRDAPMRPIRSEYEDIPEASRICFAVVLRDWTIGSGVPDKCRTQGSKALWISLHATGLPGQRTSKVREKGSQS